MTDLLKTLQGYFCRSVSAWFGALLTFAIISSLYPALLSAQGYQGFGAQTPGGEGQALYRVTNLNNSGPGSLRDAVSQGNRHIVFDVAGVISLSGDNYLQVRGAFITIDGFTAPSPGITLTGRGLSMRGDNGAHDIIVRGIRVRNSAQDGIHISHNAYNVIIDHVSIQGSGDGNVDITEGAHDVTVSWSIFAKPAGTEKNMLIKYNPSRITLHHNIFLHARQRNPQVRIDDAGTPATETTVDMRNNLVWGWEGSHGSLIWYGPWVNAVDNFYSAAGGDPKRALEVSNGARAYVAANFSNDGLTDFINTMGSETNPFPAPLVDTTAPCTAAHQIIAAAGMQPRDSIDQQYLSTISLPLCGGVANPTLEVSPSQLNFPATVGGSNPASKTLSVNGSGLSWIATTGGTWLSLSAGSGTTPSNVNVAVNSSGLLAGSHLGTISIAAAGAQNSPVLIPVTLNLSPDVTPPPPAATPKITTPNPGSTLPGASVTFQWTANGTNVSKWQLYVGSSRGAKDIHDSGKLHARTTSRSVSGLPTDGRAIWLQVRFNTGENWQSADFKYTAAPK